MRRAGRGALVRAVREADDLELVSAVARSAAGRDLGEALGGDALGVPVFAKVADALPGVDVLVDYTSATAVRKNTMAAIDEVGVVVGSSGLTAEDFAEIDAAARERSVGVVASGNFSVTAAMCQAAAHLRGSPPAVLGGDRLRERDETGCPERNGPEIAERLAEIREPAVGHPIDDPHGPKEAQGATVAGTQVHSIRLPSFVVSTEVVFARADERLTIRHDAGGSPAPDRGRCSRCGRCPRSSGSRGLDTLLLDPR